MIREKYINQISFSIAIDENEHMEKRNTSTSFGDITPLQHPIYLQPNNKDTEEALSEIEVTAEVVEEVVVTHVVEMATEMVEAVVVTNKFAM